jgi:hypothetical protein
MLEDVPWIDDGTDTCVPHAQAKSSIATGLDGSTLISNHTLVTATVVWMTMGNWQSLGDGSQVSKPIERENVANGQG